MASARPQGISAAGKAAWPLLALTAAYQAYDGLSSLAYVFMGVSNPSAGLGGWTVAAAGALQSVVAVPAFVLAARRELRSATIAVAGCIMMGWLATLPSVVHQGLDVRDARLLSAYFVVSPLIALAAAALAWRGTYPVLAAFVVIAPTLVGLLFVIGFGIVIAVHGF